MRLRPTQRTPPPELSEAWWPLEDVAPTNSAWHADHVESGWWDPGDMHRTRLRHAGALIDELLASLPQDAAGGDGTLLELGCGPGTGLQELAARTAFALHGWDAAPYARTHAPVMAPAAVVHDVEAPPLALADGSVDVVWAPRSFARGGPDWSALLAEAHRLLAPGGLLAAVTAGPGVWAWERRDDAWDEELTGLLVVGLDRSDDRGGPICFSSRWWLEEHWGRGFAPVVLRPAGVAMVHPDRGFGLGVWRRREGPAMPAAEFAAVSRADVREGPAFRRQLELAHAEARGDTARRTADLSALERRAEALTGPGAVDDHPRVRDARDAVAALEAEVERLRASARTFA